MASTLPSVDDLLKNTAPSSKRSFLESKIAASKAGSAPVLNVFNLNAAERLDRVSRRNGGVFASNFQFAEFATRAVTVSQHPYSAYHAPSMHVPATARQGFPHYRQQQFGYQSRPRRQVWNCNACMRHFFDEPAYAEHLTQHIKCPHKQCKYEAHVNIVIKHFELQHLTGLFERIGKLETPEEIAEWRELRKKRYPKHASKYAKKPNESKDNIGLPRMPNVTGQNCVIRLHPKIQKRVRSSEDDDAEEGELSSSDDETSAFDDDENESDGKVAVINNSCDSTAGPAVVDTATALKRFDISYLLEVFDYFSPSSTAGKSRQNNRRGNLGNHHQSKKKLSLRDKLVQADLRKDFELLKRLGIYSREHLERCMAAKDAVACDASAK